MYLLHHLELPNRDRARRRSNEFLVDERELVPFLTELMPTLAQQTSPMSMLRTSVSAASAYDPDGWDVSARGRVPQGDAADREDATFIATYHRLRTGQEFVPPNPKLPHAANFLWMLLGEEPDPGGRRRARHDLHPLRRSHDERVDVHRADHRLHAVRHVLSAITGAIGALKGPLHGGANEEAMKMAEEVGTPDQRRGVRAGPARAAAEDHGLRPRRVPHDGPARHGAEADWRRDSASATGNTRWYEISEAIEEVTLDEQRPVPERRPLRGGRVPLARIPTDLMTPIFALARMAGWTAHVREQYADNKVIRPGSEYVGPADRTYVPIDRRP